MPTSQHNARNSDAYNDTTTTADRLLENHREVVCRFYCRGWDAPILEGRLSLAFRHTTTPQGLVAWECLYGSRLRLSRMASLHLLQGLSLKELLAEPVQLEQEGQLSAVGQLHFLRGRNDMVWAGGGYLENVVLAHVLAAPSDLPPAQLLGHLFQEVSGG